MTLWQKSFFHENRSLLCLLYKNRHFFVHVKLFFARRVSSKNDNCENHPYLGGFRNNIKKIKIKIIYFLFIKL